MTDTGDVGAWMEKLDKLINDKNLTHPRVFYTWRETRELIDEALAERESLRAQVTELEEEMAGMIPIEQA
jgi:hypothetical protein